MIEIELLKDGSGWWVDRIALTQLDGERVVRTRGDWSRRAGVTVWAAVLAVIKLRSSEKGPGNLDARRSTEERKLGDTFRRIWNAPGSTPKHWSASVFDTYPSKSAFQTTPLERFMHIHGNSENLMVKLDGLKVHDVRFSLGDQAMPNGQLEKFLQDSFGLTEVSRRNKSTAPEVAPVNAVQTRRPERETQPPVPKHSLLVPASWPELMDQQIDGPESEMIVKLRRELDEVQRLPQDDETYRRQLRALRQLGRLLIARKGYAATEVQEVYTAARRTWHFVHDPEEYFPAVWGIWAYHLVRGELRDAAETGELLLRHATGTAHNEALVRSHNVLLATCCYQGKIDLAVKHLEDGLQAYKRRGPQTQYLSSYDEDVNVSLHANGAWALWAAGRLKEAFEFAEHATAQAHEHATPFTLAHALYFAARLHQLCGRHEDARKLALNVMQISRDNSFPLWWGGAAVIVGDSLSQEGKHGEAVTLIDRGIQTWYRIGARVSLPYFLVLLARARMRSGDLHSASEAAESALSASHEMGSALHESEALIIRGELLQNRRPKMRHDAENAFLQAIECAGLQHACSLELRARLALSRLLMSLGSANQSCKLLEDGLAQFGPGEQSPDIAEARQILGKI